MQYVTGVFFCYHDNATPTGQQSLTHTIHYAMKTSGRTHLNMWRVIYFFLSLRFLRPVIISREYSICIIPLVALKFFPDPWISGQVAKKEAEKKR